MKKILIAAAAAVTVLSAGSIMAPRANAMPLGLLPAEAIDQTSMVDQVALCFYVDGWNGPGFYNCGYRYRRGLGWYGHSRGGGYVGHHHRRGGSVHIHGGGGHRHGHAGGHRHGGGGKHAGGHRHGGGGKHAGGGGRHGGGGGKHGGGGKGRH